MPQLVGFWVVSTQLLPQRVGAVAEHPLAQEEVPPDIAQTGVAPEHALPHRPQLSCFDKSVSHPSSGFAVQCPQPDAHEEAGKEHLPFAQVTGPPTFGSLVQSWPQAPQLCTSFGTHAPPQIKPAHPASARPPL